MKQSRGKTMLVVDNPSVYSMSLSTVTLDGQNIDAQMVLSKAHLSLPLPANARVDAGSQYDLSLTYISDFGAASDPLKACT